MNARHGRSSAVSPAAVSPAAVCIRRSRVRDGEIGRGVPLRSAACRDQRCGNSTCRSRAMASTRKELRKCDPAHNAGNGRHNGFHARHVANFQSQATTRCQPDSGVSAKSATSTRWLAPKWSAWRRARWTRHHPRHRIGSSAPQVRPPPGYVPRSKPGHVRPDASSSAVEAPPPIGTGETFRGYRRRRCIAPKL